MAGAAPQQGALAILLCSAVGEAVYSQFNFFAPLNMEQLYGQQGAV